MLSQWTLENFKSFRARQTLKLSSVNVFAGANSSGKSTIMQSILLLKQTLQYGPDNRTLMLNGPILKLGTFDGVINDNAQDRTMSVGLTLTVSAYQGGDRPNWLRNQVYYSEGVERGLTSLEAELQWGLAALGEPTNANEGPQYKALDKLYPSLDVGRLTSNLEDGDTATERNWDYAQQAEQDWTGHSPPIGFGDQNYSADLDEKSEAEIAGKLPSGRVLGSSLKHFLPHAALLEFDSRAVEAIAIAEAIASPRQRTLATSRRGIAEDAAAHPEVLQIVQDWATENGLDVNLRNANTIGQIRNAIRSAFPNVPGNFANRNAALFETLSTRIETKLQAILPGSWGFEIASPRELSAAQRVLRTYLTEGVKYLGPLRNDPKPVYPVEALENLTDVGYRGEHTAAVLDLNRDKQVLHLLPRQIEAKDYQPQKVSLQHAVDEWCRYMGVAATVATEDRDVFGHQLQIETEPNLKRRDLTNVGVGVSQVLPILVMAMLAPRGSLLIFEQPELHLHPKVQARLADFFFATGLVGKQCLLETHSEHLIARLRRRIAEDDTDRAHQLVKIFFVERDGVESQCTPVEISAYGAFMQWPKDFFDQSHEEAEAILSAASRKKRPSA